MKERDKTFDVSVDGLGPCLLIIGEHTTVLVDENGVKYHGELNSFVAKAMRQALVGRSNAAARIAEFWMVYREGGREPTFKHSTADDARREAQRIAKASVSVTYVLAAVEKIEPNTMPTVDEFRRHAEIHGPGDEIGLWRVTRAGDRLPAIIGVRIVAGEAWWTSHVTGVNLHRVGVHQGDKWFPLDADGKDVDNSDIPF